MSRSPADKPDGGAFKLANKIYALGLLAHESPDLDQVFVAISRRILEETDGDLAGVALVDASARELVHACGIARDGSEVKLDFRQPIGNGVMGRTVDTGQPVVVDDVSGYPDYVAIVEGMQSNVAVPLVLGGEVIGAINLESAQKGKFGPDVVALLQAIAAPVALAVKNAWLHQQQLRRMNQLALLNRVSRILTSTTNLDELMQRTADSVREQLGFFLVAVGVLDPETNRVVLRAASSEIKIRLPIGHSQALGEGVTGQVAVSGKSLLIPDVREHPNYVAAHPDIRCEMCSPLKIGDRVVGFLDAESTRSGAFDRDDVMVFETVADHISQAVENARNLDQLARLRRDLAAMLVHDLRNPLMVINSSFQMLEMGSEKEPAAGPTRVDLRKYLAHGRHAAGEMLSLLNSFLEVEKLESERLQLSRSPVDGVDLVHEVTRKMHVVAEYKKVALKKRVVGNVPLARLDRALVLRVLENLVINALKFTPEGGAVSVAVVEPSSSLITERLKDPGSAVLFTVSDTGPGIPKGDWERIFDKFGVVQARKAGRRHAIGLGLAFCRHVAEAHGGVIWVESEVDKGSTFHFLAPVK